MVCGGTRTKTVDPLTHPLRGQCGDGGRNAADCEPLSALTEHRATRGQIQQDAAAHPELMCFQSVSLSSLISEQHIQSSAFKAAERGSWLQNKELDF